MKYRKKPVEIKAIQFAEDADQNETDDGVFAWSRWGTRALSMGGGFRE
jgi:hypothetical protein